MRKLLKENKQEGREEEAAGGSIYIAGRVIGTRKMGLMAELADPCRAALRSRTSDDEAANPHADWPSAWRSG